MRGCAGKTVKFLDNACRTYKRFCSEVPSLYIRCMIFAFTFLPSSVLTLSNSSAPWNAVQQTILSTTAATTRALKYRGPIFKAS